MGQGNKIKRLEAKCDSLMRLAVSQSAMRAMLVGLLVRKSVLTQDEAQLLTAASQHALSIPDMTPEKIDEWARNNVADMGLPGRMDNADRLVKPPTPKTPEDKG